MKFSPSSRRAMVSHSSRLLGDDIRWRIIGTTEWSGAWEGKAGSAERACLDPLFAQFATRYRNTAIRLIAEEDYVVIECRGDVTTTGGSAVSEHLLLRLPARWTAR